MHCTKWISKVISSLKGCPFEQRKPYRDQRAYFCVSNRKFITLYMYGIYSIFRNWKKSIRGWLQFFSLSSLPSRVMTLHWTRKGTISQDFIGLHNSRPSYLLLLLPIGLHVQKISPRLHCVITAKNLCLLPNQTHRSACTPTHTMTQSLC